MWLARLRKVAICVSRARIRDRERVDDEMRFLLKVAAVLAISVLTPAAAPAYGGEQASPNDTARFLAGMHPSPQSPLAPLTQDRGWQQHADTLNAIWAGLEPQQLSKIRDVVASQSDGPASR